MNTPRYRMLANRSLGVAVLTIAAALPRCAHAQDPTLEIQTVLEEPITDREFHLRVAPAVTAEISAYIDLLGSPEYADRTRAAERLLDIGSAAFSMLRQAWHTSDDPEVRLRIEEIVHQAYLDEYVLSRNGFLGITQSQDTVNHAEDPRVSEGHLGMKVAGVHDDTAASRGGLLKDDVITSVNGELIAPSSNPTAAFGNMIRANPPGTMVTLTVLRGVDELDVVVTMGRPPERLVRESRIGSVSEQYSVHTHRFRIWWTRYFKPPLPATDSPE